MNRWKKVLVAIVCATILGSGYWYHLVTSYESELGTTNTFVIRDAESSVSNATNDSLLFLEFDSGFDQLEWTYTTVSISQGSNVHDCTLGGLTSVQQQSGKVQSKLNADSQTFTLLVDATSETSFTKFSLDTMSESTTSNFSLRFSKTDIFLADHLSWFVVEDIEYNQLSEVPEGNVSDENSDGLNWYEYDISTHRVESLDQIYIVDDGSTIYKIQFLSYYNQEDESRHITFIASWLAGDSIAAINDPNLVKISPCIIVDDNLVWSLSESILIYENGYQICQFSCQLEVVVRFENVKVKGDKSIELH